MTREQLEKRIAELRAELLDAQYALMRKPHKLVDIGDQCPVCASQSLTLKEHWRVEKEAGMSATHTAFYKCIACYVRITVER